MPEYLHELIVGLARSAAPELGRARGALVAGSGAKFAVRPNRGRMPDLTVFLAGGPRPPKRGLIAVPPTRSPSKLSPLPPATSGATAWRSSSSTLPSASSGIGSSIRSSGASKCSSWVRTDATHTRRQSRKTQSTVPGCEGLRFDVCALWAEMDALDEA